ncbi:MAG TPA: hypothetical protein VLH41_11030 [Thermoanaerobaculia bacterium]|nr:hypothetical protein [Thermoanaerobaculia bacterium]
MRHAAALVLVFSAAGAAADPPPPTPPPQSVVVPSLPDQKNKEGTVRPSGSLATDEAGWVKNAPGAVDPKAGTAAGAGAGTSAAGPGAYPDVPPPGPGPAPTGKAVVDAAYLSVRGVVKAHEAGRSVTIVDASGKERTVPLAAKAEVYDGLKAGDKVVLRVPLKKPGDGKSADRVEKQKPPKATPKSKFSQAQTSGG